MAFLGLEHYFLDPKLTLAPRTTAARLYRLQSIRDRDARTLAETRAAAEDAP